MLKGVVAAGSPVILDAWAAMCNSKPDRGTPLSNPSGRRLFRDSCVDCREPLRVTEDRLFLANYCESCWPEHWYPGAHAQKIDPDDSPAWHNAVRTMEDCA